MVLHSGFAMAAAFSRRGVTLRQQEEDSISPNALRRSLKWYFAHGNPDAPAASPSFLDTGAEGSGQVE
jgi:hypothetical protein